MLTYVFAFLAFARFYVSGLTIPVQHQPRLALPFALKLGQISSTIADYDRSRVRALTAAAQSPASTYKRTVFSNSDVSVNVTNAETAYTAVVGIGTPATEYTLLIDTGSANTWIGSTSKYVKTRTSVDTGDSISISYGSGSVIGEEFLDTITLSPTLIVKNQSIGIASTSQGFAGLDGILGLGPRDLTVGTVHGQKTVATVTDNLFAQHEIASDSVAISFNPITASTQDIGGELTFGQTDPSKFTGSVSYIPITTTSPSSQFFGIDQTVTYGTGSAAQTILSSTAGIVDTGTTLILLATDAFKRYQSTTGGVLDSSTGLLKFTTSQFQNLQSLFFKVGNSTYELTPNAQIWPRSLNADIGGSSGVIYSIISDLQVNSGSGLDFVNGCAFLQRFYSVYDSTNSRVGLATTSHTFDTTN